MVEGAPNRRRRGYANAVAPRVSAVTPAPAIVRSVSGCIPVSARPGPPDGGAGGDAGGGAVTGGTSVGVGVGSGVGVGCGVAVASGVDVGSGVGCGVGVGAGTMVEVSSGMPQAPRWTTAPCTRRPA